MKHNLWKLLFVSFKRLTPYNIALPAPLEEAERLLSDARLKLKRKAKQHQRENLATYSDRVTPLQLASKADTQLKEWGVGPFMPMDEGDFDPRDAIADTLTRNYPIDDETGNTIIDDEYTAVLLQRMFASKEPAPITLTDAVRLYTKEKLSGESFKLEKDKQRIERIVREVEAVTGSNPVLTTITREQARQVRDNLLKVKKPATVEREFNTLKAVINYAIKEFDLTDMANAFRELSMPRHSQKSAATHSEAELKERRSLTDAETKIVSDYLATKLKQPSALFVWRMLKDSGCRLAEIAVLKASDVKLDVEGLPPHLNIAPNERRRLKNASSVRLVPLVGEALGAAGEALNQAQQHGHDYLFNPYSTAQGTHNLSKTIMKHLRKVIEDEKATTHSLRHRVKNKLHEVGVPKNIQDSILGHAAEGVGDRVYLHAESKLKPAAQAMTLALCPIEREDTIN
ncbi:hypothetical protein E1162_06205 [Rhodobacteraceae bacterium RKSG542]|uniref:site-specific integrase n=1 Tax=Pseudovibrio flavus TaxID=2529854 RepID=UPI0012BD3B2A|nr:site-specific integrase [Pseudovibrio flavus]MTI16826.1 hypothetical protein [Pseudovibrio flavus]